MKQHTAEELESMPVKDVESYYKELHTEHAKKGINPLFL